MPSSARSVKPSLTRLSIVSSNALTLPIALVTAFRISEFIETSQLPTEGVMETALKCRTMLLIVTTVIAGAVQAEDGKQIVQAANTQWLSAFNSGKAAALPAMYTTDAILLADGSAPITGRDGIQKYWEGALKMGLKDHTFTPIAIKQEGKVAYQAATWTIMAPKEGGGSTQATGSAVHVLEKQPDGKWLIKVHIYNTK
jgi:uncharacterized protein (TIGR02246 family)